MSTFEPPMPESSGSQTPKSKRPIYKRKWVIALAVMAVIGWLAPSQEDRSSQATDKSISSSKSSTTPTIKKVVLPWYPEGFNEYQGDSQIAWRWLESAEYSCSYGDHCWGIEIIAREGCPTSLYAEITILDSADTNIGFTNDTTSGLGAGQKAKLVFEDFTPGAKSARLAEVSCY